MVSKNDMSEEHWRKRLLERKNELVDILDHSKDSSAVVELDQTKVGRLSRMDALQGQAMAQATRERMQNELSRIDASLQRLREGEYGYCLKCGEEISSKRLGANPTTTLCIECAD